nr:hypothetical protein [Tanacetum cinerariifolium]
MLLNRKVTPSNIQYSAAYHRFEGVIDDGERIAIGQDTQELTTTAIFQTDYLYAFNSDYDEASLACAVLMAKLSAYDLDVRLE